MKWRLAIILAFVICVLLGNTSATFATDQEIIESLGLTKSMIRSKADQETLRRAQEALREGKSKEEVMIQMHKEAYGERAAAQIELRKRKQAKQERERQKKLLESESMSSDEEKIVDDPTDERSLNRFAEEAAQIAPSAGNNQPESTSDNRTWFDRLFGN